MHLSFLNGVVRHLNNRKICAVLTWYTPWGNFPHNYIILYDSSFMPTLFVIRRNICDVCGDTINNLLVRNMFIVTERSLVDAVYIKFTQVDAVHTRKVWTFLYVRGVMPVWNNVCVLLPRQSMCLYTYRAKVLVWDVRWSVSTNHPAYAARNHFVDWARSQKEKWEYIKNNLTLLYTFDRSFRLFLHQPWSTDDQLVWRHVTRFCNLVFTEMCGL